MQNALFEKEALAEQEGPISVGQLLKGTRESLGISLETAAHTLRISASHLIRLEVDHDTLVCDVYTLGFLRSYAKFLGLNANALIQKFREQVAPNSPSDLVFLTPSSEKETPSLRILVFSLLVFLGIALFTGYQWWSPHQENFPQIPPHRPTPTSLSPSREPPPPTPPKIIEKPPSFPRIQGIRNGALPNPKKGDTDPF